MAIGGDGWDMTEEKVTGDKETMEIREQSEVNLSGGTRSRWGARPPNPEDGRWQRPKGWQDKGKRVVQPSSGQDFAARGEDMAQKRQCVEIKETMEHERKPSLCLRC